MSKTVKMKEELVTLETAKLLMNNGFDWKCEDLIDINGNVRNYFYPQSELCCMEIDGKPFEFLCPKLYIAQKWLRETKNLHISIIRNACGYGYDICKADNGTHITDGIFDGPNDGGQWDTYEEALEVGIQEALKLV